MNFTFHNILFFLTFLIISCKTVETSTETIQQTTSLNVTTSIPITESTKTQTIEDPLLLYIYRHAPNLKQGMTKEEVESFLTLNKRFNGLIFSEGTKTAFIYTYEICNYELQLTFNYSSSARGSFMSWSLIDEQGSKVSINY